jgi:hypothetical protein
MEAPGHQVPSDLMDRFHDAIARFHKSKTEIEAAMDSSEYRHQERVTAATNQFRVTERDVEEVEKQISEVLSANRPN